MQDKCDNYVQRMPTILAPFPSVIVWLDYVNADENVFAINTIHIYILFIYHINIHLLYINIYYLRICVNGHDRKRMIATNFSNSLVGQRVMHFRQNLSITKMFQSAVI